MKNLVSILVALTLMFGLLSVTQATSKMNVYSLDGRVEVIDVADFNAWHAVGWYSAPVMNIYTLDGRSQIILKSDFNAWHAVGWYSAPVMTVYSLDGRSRVIVKSDFDAWHAVGWYSAPVMTVYAPDGRSQVIVKSDFNAWRAVGWNGIPDIPAPYQEKINEYKNALTMGQKSFQKAYPDDKSVNTLMIGYAYWFGNASFAYTLYDVDKNGIPELIFSNRDVLIDIYTLNNGNLVKLFEECYFGERARLHILSDGTLLTEGSSGAATSSCETYKLSWNGYSLSRTDAFYFDGMGRDPYMYDYEYLTPDAYSNRLSKYLSYSIFDNLTWYVFATK